MMKTLVGFHAVIGVLEAVLTVALVGVVANVRGVVRTSPVFAGAAAVVLAGLAAVGASPWPDGLERSLTLHGISPSASGVLGAIERFQAVMAPFANQYTAFTTAVGALAVGTIAVAAGVLAVRRGREGNGEMSR